MPFQRIATTFGALFKDVIVRAASKYALPVAVLNGDGLPSAETPVTLG